MIKKIIILGFFLVLASILLLPSASMEEGTESFTSSVFRQGEKLLLEISLKEVENLFGVGINLEYDPNVLSFITNIEPANFAGLLESDGKELSQMPTVEKAKMIVYGKNRTKTSGIVSGMGRITTFVFEILSPEEEQTTHFDIKCSLALPRNEILTFDRSKKISFFNVIAYTDIGGETPIPTTEFDIPASSKDTGITCFVECSKLFLQK